MNEVTKRRVGDRGQVTLLKELREEFDIGGDEVEIRKELGKIVIEKPVAREDLAAGYRTRADHFRELHDKMDSVSKEADEYPGDVPEREQMEIRRGDIVIVEIDPAKGSEQRGHDRVSSSGKDDSSISTTYVPRDMSADADDNGDMVKLNVKVPKRLLEEIDELAEELEYTNRSEFVREVLRDTTEPILTPGAQEGVSEGYADVAAGRTMSTDEARERLGIDQD